MWNGVLAPEEVSSLKNFMGDEKKTPPFESLTSSLIDFRDDHFVSYNRARHTLCVGSVKKLVNSVAQDDLPVDEELHLTVQQWFEISQLSLFPNADYCCLLWGSRGIVIVSIEHRNSSSRLQITKEHFIAESVYRDHPTLSIFQCRWSPIRSAKIVMVLNSDSFLRVYNVMSGDTLGCFNLGPKISLPLVTTFSPDINPETPIDFDFGPYISVLKSWMILVLKPTGLIYCALLGIVATNTQCFINYYRHVQYSSSTEEEENYTRILCSKQFPIVCVTGQESGFLSHSIMVPTRLEEDDVDLEDQVDKHLMNDSYKLFIKERLKLPKRSSGHNEYESSLQLLQDPLFDNRYICAHDSGLNIITIKFAPEVQKFLMGDEDALESLTSSVCRHLMVWNVGDTVPTFNKLIGISFTASQPERLLCVLNDARAIIYLIPHPADIRHFEEKKEIVSVKYDPTNSRSILDVIKSILGQSPEQPFYCCDQDELGTAESRKLLQATLKSKFKRLCSLERASEYLASYLKSIRSKTKDMETSVKNLLDARGEIKDAAQNIAEIYEDLSEEDQVTRKRMDVVMYRFHQTFPILTDKEKEWRQILETISREITSLKSSTESLHHQVAEMKETLPTQPVKLKAHQLESIKEQVMHNQTVISTMKNSLLQMQDKILRQ